MKYLTATEKDTKQITALVQNTIKTIYPKYYPQEVVDFFCELHREENIAKDIAGGLVGVLIRDNEIVATGCYKDNHITRVYVSPEFQGQGFGSYIMNCLEDKIAQEYDTVYLDASLPASHLYEKRGYRTMKHDKWNVENGVVLVYEIMEKSFSIGKAAGTYDGKYFVSKTNTENGEVDGNTVFAYHQKNNMVWADYSGGEILKGNLLGTVAESGELDFYYQHLNEQGQVRVGICHSVPRVLENGKLELLEKWQWLNGDKSKGESIIVEK